MTGHPRSAWHILDNCSVPVAEFASALHALVPTIAWQRHISAFAALYPFVRLDSQSDPPLDIAHFPLQRGFSSRFLTWAFDFAEDLNALLLAYTGDPHLSPLICTSSFYAPVAERWPGPVVYYATDLTFAYDQLDPKQVLELDRRLCYDATLVCPNSRRIGEYFVAHAHCDPSKIVCLPNATRHSNIFPEFIPTPTALPADVADLPRPIAGVIGNLAANLDWVLLENVIQACPWLSWIFVGPTSMAIEDREQKNARDRVMNTGSRVRFVGLKPYASLRDYARSFDVAILPYFKREPTFSGSPTRFYEHLAACRPMLSTKGVEQLLHKEPLVRLLDGPDEMRAALEQLKASGFVDGYERIRWEVSRKETWTARANDLVQALQTSKQLASQLPAESFSGQSK